MLKIAKTRPVKTPSRGTSESAGYDFYVPEDQPSTILAPGSSVMIKSGIKMMIPANYVGIFFNKSSIGQRGIIVGAQVVDADYRGEIHLNVINTSHENYVIKPGQKLTQMIIQEYQKHSLIEVSEDLFDQNTTQRGAGGFGSTGA